MSDLENRRRHEAETAAILARLFGAQRQIVRDAIGPDLEFRLPPERWMHFTHDTAAALRPQLRDVYIASALQLPTVLTVAAIAQAADNWSRVQAFKLAVQLTTTTSITIRRVLGAARGPGPGPGSTPTPPPSGLGSGPVGPVNRLLPPSVEWEVARAEALDRAFGLTRIEAIAPTEVTRAAASGQDETVGRHEALTGRAVDQLWHTEEDGKVCPICKPLNGTLKTVWGRYFLFGPPAHTNCRCWIDYDLEDDD